MKTILSLLLLSPGLLLAELSVPHFFADHMILQRERAAAIWGKAHAGAEISVAFKGKSAATKADADGKWRTQIETGAADATGVTLTISAGADKIEIKDVLVGEVWFASGQSNMFFTMNRVPAYEALIKESKHPALRMFNAPLVTAADDQDDIEGVWAASTPEMVPDFSAVAFFFARKLHLDLGIPVGVIKSAWGGKPVETFTSREALNTLPGTKALVDAMLKDEAAFDQAKAQAAYETKLEQWQSTVAAAKGKSAEERKRLPKKPDAPKRPLLTEGKPGVLFAAMIHPFTGYTMRGAIWYQGEGNARAGAVPYDQTLPLMINDWRKRWGDDFSFYFVQLANYHAPSTAPGTPDAWALLQDRMRLVLDTTPKTGMAIINDVGEVNDIHPKNKKDPGERLARWALAKDYGKELIYSGPLFKLSSVKDGAIRVTFDQSGAGLKSRDGGALKRFEIAGADKVWMWADAKIDGTDSVIVSSTEVKAPAAVRYAWAANPEGANLINSEGLPASVFRTDDWDDVEIQVDTAAEERRAMGVEIRALATELAKHDRKSPEYQALNQKFQALMTKFKASAPKK
ncbi:MAG: sialate O-acetylesterase [Prosthecobacter sp.]|uniref:sialate O-acetylesterase n=1 Tax=Prosthecobacter sp. TaxID=1965333 RepID=UPI003900D4BF